MLPHESSPRLEPCPRLDPNGFAAVAADSASAGVKALFASPLSTPALPSLNHRRCTLTGSVPLTDASVFTRVARLDG